MNKLIAHALIQNKEGEILIIKRCLVERGKTNFQGGMWDITGGTVEHLEFPSNAAIREAKEEVGLEVEIDNILYEKSNFDAQKNTIFTTLIYKCKKDNYMEVTLDYEEHDDYKWVTAKEILDMDDKILVSYMKDAVKSLILH